MKIKCYLKFMYHDFKHYLHDTIKPACVNAIGPMIACLMFGAVVAILSFVISTILNVAVNTCVVCMGIILVPVMTAICHDVFISIRRYIRSLKNRC